MRLLAHRAVTAAIVVLSLSACAEKPLPTSMQSPAGADALVPIGGGGIIIRPVFPGPDDFTEITAGANHTCARKINGTVYCWGADNLGQSATWSTKTCSNGLPCVDRPRMVILAGVGLTAKSIDAGYNHTCALGTTNEAYCWGDGNQGQVGFATGSYGYIYEPLKVVGGLTFSSIGAGTNSTCGTTSGGMYCWGSLMNRAATPTLVSSWNGYNTVSVGDLHACALYVVGSYRSVDCWGNNRYGQLGSDPAQLPYGPFTVGTGFTNPANRVATEASFTCVDQPNATVQCAGENTWGMLGNGQSGTYTSTGTPQVVGGGTSLYGVSTGRVHACALSGAGAAYCWGNGYNGQVGNNAYAVATSPQLVTGGRTYRAVAAGNRHSCAIGTDNHIYCWGQNDNGQLGTQYPGGYVSNPVQALDP